MLSENRVDILHCLLKQHRVRFQLFWFARGERSHIVVEKTFQTARVLREPIRKSEEPKDILPVYKAFFGFRAPFDAPPAWISFQLCKKVVKRTSIDAIAELLFVQV